MNIAVFQIPNFLLSAIILGLSALTFAAYFPSIQIQSFNISSLPSSQLKLLRFVSMTLLIICCMLFLPIFPYSCNTVVFEKKVPDTNEFEMLNVRHGPGLKYRIIGKLAHETKIKVINFDKGWAEISKPRGWVAGNLTKTRQDCQRLFRNKQ